MFAPASRWRLRSTVSLASGFSENPASRALVVEFRSVLAKMGWEESGNFQIELRWGEGNAARIGEFTQELVALGPDAILAQTTPVANALARETKTIPIVFVTVSDPIGSGLAGSFTHPAGNITGFTFVQSEMGGKWLQLLLEIAPATARV